MTAPERMFVREKPNGAMGRWHDATSLPEIAAITSDGSNPMRPYILATPEVLAASPEVQALVMAERERCARIADEHRDPAGTEYDEGWDASASSIAAAIRAGTEVGE
jgi:hypothetical protein